MEKRIQTVTKESKEKWKGFEVEKISIILMKYEYTIIKTIFEHLLSQPLIILDLMCILSSNNYRVVDKRVQPYKGSVVFIFCI